VDAKEAAETKAALRRHGGHRVGTHALLAEASAFQALGLVIVDEEQHSRGAQGTAENLKAVSMS